LALDFFGPSSTYRYVRIKEGVYLVFAEMFVQFCGNALVGLNVPITDEGSSHFFEDRLERTNTQMK
jgi:hypothetical protein